MKRLARPESSGLAGTATPWFSDRGSSVRADTARKFSQRVAPPESWRDEGGRRVVARLDFLVGFDFRRARFAPGRSARRRAKVSCATTQPSERYYDRLRRRGQRLPRASLASNLALTAAIFAFPLRWQMVLDSERPTKHTPCARQTPLPLLSTDFKQETRGRGEVR